MIATTICDGIIISIEEIPLVFGNNSTQQTLLQEHINCDK